MRLLILIADGFSLLVLLLSIWSESFLGPEEDPEDEPPPE